MRVHFSAPGWLDFRWWRQGGDAVGLARVDTLIEAVRREPFTGLGKPEPLRGQYQGYWSRRITGEHRLIYRVSGSGDTRPVEIVACRFHY